MYKNKRLLPFYVAIATTFIGSNASSEVELTGKVIHENAVFSQSGSTIGDRGKQATTGTGMSQTPLTKNGTAEGMYRGVEVNGASAAAPTHNNQSNLKSESTVKLYFDGTTELLNGATFHTELNLVSDNREGLDKENSSYSQRDFLREAYIDTTVSDWMLRAGKQQVVWGTADGMKLLDTINPTDYAEMAQNQMEDSRIPVWMLNGEKINEDGSSLQVILSQPKENIFPGLNRSIDTSERANSNMSLDDGTLNNGTDTGNAFMLMGPDSITGVYNGFLNIAPDLGSVATRFASAFKPSNNANNWDYLSMENVETGAYSINFVSINAAAPTSAMDSAAFYFGQAFAGATSYLGGEGPAANGMNTFTVGGFKGMDMATMSDALNPSGATGAQDYNLQYIPPGFKKAILDTWQGLLNKYDNAAGITTALGSPVDITSAAGLTGDHMLALGFAPLYNTNLSNLTAAQDDAFDYMDNTTFKTFDAYANATSKYVYKMPDDSEFDLAARYNNTTKDGLNYSLVASYNYDKNPIINLSWRGDKGQVLTVRQTYHDATGNGITKAAYDALVYDKDNPYTRKSTTLQLYDAADSAATTAIANTIAVTANGTVNGTASNGFYGGMAQQSAYDASCLASGCDDSLGMEMGAAYQAAAAKRAQLQFLQEVARVTQIGGAFDYAIDSEKLGPIVIRGEALYTKDGYSPVMNKDRLAIGDLVGALQMKKSDRFKFVLGADVTLLTNMMVSGQFIQDSNLDFVDNGNEYTTDYATMHLSNGFKKAKKDKNFYSLFLSKPFGESGQHRWNNILMLEDTGGRWNRFDVEYTIDDNTVGSLEVNEYWGETNSQFGQLKNSSNVQLGLKYSF